MVPATSPAFLRLSDGKVLGKPTPATPENSLRITPLPTRKPANLRPTPVVIELDPSDVAKTSAGHGAASADDGAATGTKKAHDRTRKQGSQR
jgi:hypothetical protein